MFGSKLSFIKSCHFGILLNRPKLSLRAQFDVLFASAFHHNSSLNFYFDFNFGFILVDFLLSGY